MKSAKMWGLLTPFGELWVIAFSRGVPALFYREQDAWDLESSIRYTETDKRCSVVRVTVTWAEPGKQKKGKA